MSPITENELRTAVKLELAQKAASTGARLYEELGIERGAARIDLAMVGRLLEGYEIKSDLDNFARLHNQIHAYNRLFDRITLIAGPAHCERLLDVIPSWWGVVAGRHSDAGVTLTELRSAKDNPQQDPYSLAMMLWRDEAVAILQNYSATIPSKISRAQLYERIVDLVPKESLRERVADALATRQPLEHRPS